MGELSNLRASFYLRNTPLTATSNDSVSLLTIKIPRIILLLALLPAVCTGAPAADKDAPKMGDIATTVARMLESAHYSRMQLDADVTPGVTQARRALERHLQLLDYNRLFFTQADIDDILARHGDTIQNDIMLGNLTPVYEIYDRYLARVTARVEKINSLLEKNYTFDSKRTASLNRDKLPWPANEKDADRIWADRLEAELLQANLAEHDAEEAAAKKKEKKSTDAADQKPDVASAETAPAPPQRTPKERIRKRYERLLKSLHEETREDQVNTFLTALAQSYDPHSDYMSQRALDNFNIQMGLSLVGIGAELRSDDGYAKIMGLVPGGPAERGGQLKVNDRIVAVAQGNGEFEDVVDMKLDRVVERIRGKKGTTVRLQVIPSAASNSSKLNVITIVRDEVKLKDEEAKALVIDTKDKEGNPAKIGWITVPSFYSDMGQRGATPKSTTKDVAALLKRLKSEGIKGLVVDLRQDAGGSLDEAVRLTGLFIPKGPVVQVKNTNGAIEALNDKDPNVQWSGPLIVLTNRLSASASEIFAAALQDYGRAVIVGDTQTFGKGTVQALLDVDRFMPLFAASGKSGALKLTTQKFYRIKGGSTQLRGVASDIILPSTTDQPDIGESTLKNPLDYDEVPARLLPAEDTVAAILPQLREASAARIASNPEFTYKIEDNRLIHERLEKNVVSLNKSERIAERDADKARIESRKAERKKRGDTQLATAFEVTLDTVNAPSLKPFSLDKPPKKHRAEEFDEDGNPIEDEDTAYVDPVRDEALLIMRDYIRLEGNPTATAQAKATEPSLP